MKKNGIEKLMVQVVKKVATLEANTACPCWTYQAKEPKKVKDLRKF